LDILWLSVGFFGGEIMFGCFVNLCTIEGFSLQSLGPTGGLLLSMRFFFENYGLKSFVSKVLGLVCKHS
jgi:hypothetical protein